MLPPSILPAGRRDGKPALERLSSAQKLILRTGPDNARRIQDKLRAIALALGVPGRLLPETAVHRVEGGSVKRGAG